MTPTAKACQSFLAFGVAFPTGPFSCFTGETQAARWARYAVCSAARVATDNQSYRVGRPCSLAQPNDASLQVQLNSSDRTFAMQYGEAIGGLGTAGTCTCSAALSEERRIVHALKIRRSSTGLWKPLPIIVHSPKRPASLKTSPESSSPLIRKKSWKDRRPATPC